MNVNLLQNFNSNTTKQQKKQKDHKIWEDIAEEGKKYTFKALASLAKKPKRVVVYHKKVGVNESRAFFCDRHFTYPLFTGTRYKIFLNLCTFT